MISKEQQAIIEHAKNILSAELRTEGVKLTSSEVVQDFLSVNYSNLEHEVFIVLHLDNNSALIEAEELFRGTIDQTPVYPREVAKSCLQRNSAAIVIAHNHPSGNPEPSEADLSMTRQLVAAMSLLNIRVLDHIIVGDNQTMSFAEQGLI